MRGSRRGLDGLSRHSRRLAEATYARFAGAYDRIFPDAFERFASVLAQGGACDHGLRVGGSGSEVEAATDAESAAATGATAIATSTDGRGAGGASVETCLRRIWSRSAFVRMCLTLESRGFGLMGQGETRLGAVVRLCQSTRRRTWEELAEPCSSTSAMMLSATR